MDREIKYMMYLQYYTLYEGEVRAWSSYMSDTMTLDWAVELPGLFDQEVQVQQWCIYYF